MATCGPCNGNGMIVTGYDPRTQTAISVMCDVCGGSGQR